MAVAAVEVFMAEADIGKGHEEIDDCGLVIDDLRGTSVVRSQVSIAAHPEPATATDD
jgi:hypothetical protein